MLKRLAAAAILSTSLASGASAAIYYAVETHTVGPGLVKTTFFGGGYGEFNLGVHCWNDFAVNLHDPIQYWMQNSATPLVPATTRPLQPVDLGAASGGFKISSPSAAIEVSCQGSWAQ